MDPSHREALLRALSRLDARDRFHAADLPALKALVTDLVGAQAPLDHPAELFGPWGRISSAAKDALRGAVEDEIKATMDLFPRGTLWNGAIRGCWELDRFIHESGRLAFARKRVIQTANRLAFGPLHLRRRLFHRSHARRWEEGREVGIATLLAALGRCPSWLLADFIQGVVVDPRARGYWYDPARNICFGSHVGLDLMPTSKGVICLEGNLQVGIDDLCGSLRRRLQPDNPTATQILDAARFQGARRIYWLEGNRIPLRPWFMQELAERARAEGIHAEIFEDPRLPTRRKLPPGTPLPNRFSWLDWVPDNTLVVRRNEYTVGSDFVINHKEPFIRGLHAVFAEKGESRAKALPQTRIPQDLADLGDDGLPNLVYKYPDSMGGKGVYFLRARDAAHALALARELDAATGEGAGVFQPFSLSELLPGGRVQDVRGEILISPLGTWYLGGLKREASKPLPNDLPEGVADAPGRLTSNMSRGGWITKVEDEEMPRFRDAALAVGEGLRTVLERTFETGPKGTGRPDPERESAEWISKQPTRPGPT